MKYQNIAVIGAGPMGLAAAYHLSKRGARVVIYEADSVPGGMSSTFDFDGIRIEKYYHFINMPDLALFDLLKELNMYDQLRWTPTKMGLFRSDPQNPSKTILHKWGNPLVVINFSGVSVSTRIRYGLHALYTKNMKDLMSIDDISASDWITKWEGKEGYDVLWRFLFEKKFFELADPLSAAWIASRVRRVGNSRKSIFQEQLGYLEGGSESLIISLSEKINKMGGELLLSNPVKKVTKHDKDIFIVETESDTDKYDAVISTIPIPYVTQIFTGLPAEYLRKIGKIKNVGCVCVLFRLKEKLTENFWLNTDIPGWDIPGIIEYSNLRPMKKSHIYMPFYMPKSHPNWHASEQEILNKARHYMYTVNPKAAMSEEAVRVFRYEYAQPVCTPGFRKILPGYETGIDGLLIADTTHSFPEDRSIQESVRIGKELADAMVTFDDRQ